MVTSGFFKDVQRTQGHYRKKNVMKIESRYANVQNLATF